MAPKTFKDSKGNIRQIGTGKLIRAAKKPAAAKQPAKRKAKTFTDGQGVLRQVGTAKNGRPAIAVNPLDRKVDAQILVQSAPVRNLIGDANKQYEAEQAAISGAGVALTEQLAQLRSQIEQASQARLGQAAAAAGGTAERQAENFAYLQSLMGGQAGTPNLGLLALAARAQGEAAGNTVDIGLGASGATGDLATMSGAAQLQRQRAIEDRAMMRDTALRDYNDQLAAIRANRTGIRNELINTSLDQQALRQQIKLAQAEFDRTGDAMKFEQEMAKLGLEADIEDSKRRAKGEAGGGSFVKWRNLNVTAGQAERAQNAIDAWTEKFTDKNRTLGSFLTTMTRNGSLNKVQSARLAMQVFRTDELKRYAKTRANFLKLMEQSGVNKATREAWANRVFGAPAAAKKPAQPRPKRQPKLGHRWHFNGSKWIEVPSGGGAIPGRPGDPGRVQ